MNRSVLEQSLSMWKSLVYSRGCSANLWLELDFAIPYSRLGTENSYPTPDYNHGQKQLRHSPNKTCFVKRVSFSISYFDISNLSSLFNVVTRWKCPRSVLQYSKGGEVGGGGAGYRQKRCFLKLRKDADGKRLFCSNVPILLSMIVAIFHAEALWLPYSKDISDVTYCY